MGTMIVITILTIALIFTASKWLKWRVAASAFVYYIEKNQYKQPDEKELDECTDFVVKNMVKDLIGK